MSAKDNAAVIRLFDLLEARYALRVIWALRDGHPQTFRLLQDSVGGRYTQHTQHPPERTAGRPPDRT